jgi:hypothetical protein
MLDGGDVLAGFSVPVREVFKKAAGVIRLTLLAQTARTQYTSAR